MSLLCHHARQERHGEQVEFVADPMDHERLDARVAEQDLLVAPGRRIALEGRLHVEAERLANVRQPLDDGADEGLGLPLLGIDGGIEAQRSADLSQQTGGQGLEGGGEMGVECRVVEPARRAEPREDCPADVLDRRGDV